MKRTPDDPCLFVLGYGRSGTTLFRRMLSAHPELYVAPENDVFQRLPQLLRTPLEGVEPLDEIVAGLPAYYQRIYDLDRFRADAAAALPLTAPEAIVLLQGAARIGADKPTARWGHKAPSEWPYLPTMREWFPQAQFLHIVRQPHDATASMVEYQLQRYRTTPLVGIWQWRKAFRAIRRHAAEVGPDRYHLLRYEDLVSDPATVLGEACDFLGVDRSGVDRMVDFTADPSSAHVDEGEHMARAETPVTDERVGLPLGEHTDERAAMLDHVCRAELDELGYRPRSPQPAPAARRAAYDAACAGLDVAWAGLRGTRRARGQL